MKDRKRQVSWGLQTECYGGGEDVSSEIQEDLDSNSILLSDHKKSFNLSLICNFCQFQTHTKCSMDVIITPSWLQNKGGKGGKTALPILPNPDPWTFPYSVPINTQAPLTFHTQFQTDGFPPCLGFPSIGRHLACNRSDSCIFSQIMAQVSSLAAC